MLVPHQQTEDKHMNDIPNSTDKPTLWAARMVAWKISGLSQVQFCKQNNLTYAAFGYWRTRLKKLNAINNDANEEPGAVKFLPVKLSHNTNAHLTLNINHQHSINILPDFDAWLLTKIIQAVQCAQ